jgi:hypothetical protein
MKPESAATKVQKHYRGHRVRLQMPIWRDPLETVVEEEAGKTVMFVESPTSESDAKMGNGIRASARKSTPFVKKEDLPHEELPAESDTESDVEDRPSAKVVEIVVPESPRDQPSRNLRAERKPTGYMKKADVPDDSDSDSGSEPEDEDIVDSPANNATVVVAPPKSDKPTHGAFRHRRGTSFISDAKPSSAVEIVN